MKKYILLLLIVAGNFVNAQSVNNYKAVVVPIKFDFLNSDNAYRLNTLSKFNLKKAGFIYCKHQTKSKQEGTCAS